jgi:hypothetical protein
MLTAAGLLYRYTKVAATADRTAGWWRPTSGTGGENDRVAVQADLTVRIRTALRASIVPFGVHALAAVGIGTWAVVQVQDPAQRGGWGPVAAILTAVFVGLPIVLISLVAALALVVVLTTVLRASVVIGIVATLAGAAATAAVIGVIHFVNQG